MAKYTITCACGHEHTFSLVGPHKSREWYLEKAKDEDCPACKEEARKATIEFENKVAAEKSAEMELPELEGSPKQIAWANTLRIAFIDIMEKKMSKVKPEYADMFQRFYDMITSETSAKFFIDTRDENISELFRKFVEEHKDEEIKAEIKEETTETIKANETVKPGTAEIVIEKETIKAIYMRDSDFIAVVKALGFKWIGNIYAKEKINKSNYHLPEGHTWKSFTEFLLDTLPKDIATHYRMKFKKFENYWLNVGCPESQKSIEILQKACGDKIINTHETSRRGNGDKEVIKFTEIVDAVPELDGKEDILTWKRLAMCIIKNDYYCRTLSFSVPKRQQEKIDFVKNKYRAIIRGEDI